MIAIRVKELQDLKLYKGIPENWNSEGNMNYLAGTVHIIDESIIQNIKRYKKNPDVIRDANFGVPDVTDTITFGKWYLHYSDVDIVDGLDYPEELI